MHRLIFFFLSFALLTQQQIYSFPSETSYCRVFFSPRDQLAEKLIEKIDQEEKSIHAAVYCFTHRGIAEALIKAKKRGVDVEVIVDAFSVKNRSPVHRLVRLGIPVYVWDPLMAQGNTGKKGIMHHKFCLFGVSSVWSGSCNFSYQAALYNRENALLIEDPLLAKQFFYQFKAMKSRDCLTLEEYCTNKPKRKKSIR